jgi:glycosyltransferase involved in cell wall biosynthesis
VKVNIFVTQPDMSWIVGRYAKELVARLPQFGIEARINDPRWLHDLEFHANTYMPPSRRPAVGLFAHDRFHLAPHFDGHIALNPFVQEQLRAFGAPDPVVIEQAVDEIFINPTPKVFGVAGSVKRDNRKGQDLVARMVAEGYDVRAWGTGWPCPIVSSDYAALPAFYRSLDYYVCTSRVEGGCTPIIECMAMGVPIITPRIGFAIRRPVLEYRAGDWDSLHGVLRYLTQHKTYDDFAHDCADYFRKVLG